MKGEDNIQLPVHSDPPHDPAVGTEQVGIELECCQPWTLVATILQLQSDLVVLLHNR